MNVELKQARTVSSTDVDARGAYTIIVNCDGERTIALAVSTN